MGMNAPLSGAPRPVLQRAAAPLFVAFQILATFLPSLGIGEPVGARSDAVRTLITPAGWAFAIWGPLYAGSVLYALYQALPAQRGNPLLARIGWYAAGAFLGNGLWVTYTQLRQVDAGSAAIILATLGCLLVVFRAVVAAPRLSRGERFLVALPLTALAAWLSAATIVNISAALKFHGVSAGAATETVGAAIVVVGGIIAALALWRGRGNPWYALVFLWALAGINATGGEASHRVGVALLVSALLVVVSAALQLARGGNRRHWFGPSGSL